jgi:hypothetical protein
MVRLTGISQDKSVNIVQSTENINMSGPVMQQDSGGGGHIGWRYEWNGA